jgi:hypothetical protein
VSAYRAASSQSTAIRSPYRGESSSRSTSRSYARGESSARNASTSSGVGGSPDKSSVARRTSVRLSASGAGARFSRARRSATKRSMGLLLGADPAGRRGTGNRRSLRRDESPVVPVFRSALDPAAQQVDLRRVQRLPRLRRGHEIVGIGSRDPLQQLAVPGLPRHDGRGSRLGGRHRRIPVIEPQPALALFVVRPVAGEALVREDRTNVAVEIETGVEGGRGRKGAEESAQDRHEREEGVPPHVVSGR